MSESIQAQDEQQTELRFRRVMKTSLAIAAAGFLTWIGINAAEDRAANDFDRIKGEISVVWGDHQDDPDAKDALRDINSTVDYVASDADDVGEMASLLETGSEWAILGGLTVAGTAFVLAPRREDKVPSDTVSEPEIV